MEKEERQNNFHDQTGELYRAYGEFAVKFEHVCHAVHTAMVFMLHMEGLKNQQVAHGLLAGLTADPLRSIFAMLVAETQQLDNQEKHIVNSVLKRFQKLTERRNDVLHGTWFIGWGHPSDTDFSVASGIKHHRSNKGASSKSFKFSTVEFQVLTREAEALAAIFQRLHGCFVGGYSISRNFIINDNGIISVP